MHYSTPQPTKKRVAFDVDVHDYQKLEVNFPYRMRPDSEGKRGIDWTAAIQALLAGAQGHQQGRVQL